MDGENSEKTEAAIETVLNQSVELETSSSSLAAIDELNEEQSLTAADTEEDKSPKEKSSIEESQSQTENDDEEESPVVQEDDNTNNTADESVDDLNSSRLDESMNESIEEDVQEESALSEMSVNEIINEGEEEGENEEIIESGNEVLNDTKSGDDSQMSDGNEEELKEEEGSMVEEEINETSQEVNTENEEETTNNESQLPDNLFDDSADIPDNSQEMEESGLEVSLDQQASGDEPSDLNFDTKRKRKASHKVIEMTETTTPVVQKGKKKGRPPKKHSTKKNSTSTPKQMSTPITNISTPNESSTKKDSSVKQDNVGELENGWKVRAVQRMSGVSMGKFDIYYFSPEGKKFRSKREIMSFSEKHNLNIDMEEFEFNSTALVTKGILNLEGVEAKEKKPKTPAKPKLNKKLPRDKMAVTLAINDPKEQSPLQKLVIKMPFGGGFGKAKMTKKETSQIRSYFQPKQNEDGENDVYNFDSSAEIDEESGLQIDEVEAASPKNFTNVVKKGKKKGQNKQALPVKPGKQISSSPGNKKKTGVKRSQDEAFGEEVNAAVNPPAGKKKKKLQAKRKNLFSSLNSCYDAKLTNSQESSGFDVGTEEGEEFASPVNEISSMEELEVENYIMTGESESMDTSQISEDGGVEEKVIPVKKKRGRPPKQKPGIVKEIEVKKQELSWEDYQKQLAGLERVQEGNDSHLKDVEPESDVKENGNTNESLENQQEVEDVHEVEDLKEVEEQEELVEEQEELVEEQEELMEEQEELVEEQEELDPEKILALARDFAKVPTEITADYILSNGSASKNKQAIKKASAVPIITTRPKSKREDKWIPPHSPFCLVQENLSHDPWKLLAATILLDNFADIADGRKVIPILWKVLNHWPTADHARNADELEMADILFPLGSNFKRAQTIIKFSDEFVRKKWSYPIELHGVTKYGNDSYRIFCVDEWKQAEPTDQKLMDYQQWLLANQKQLGLGPE